MKMTELQGCIAKLSLSREVPPPSGVAWSRKLGPPQAMRPRTSRTSHWEHRSMSSCVRSAWQAGPQRRTSAECSHPALSSRPLRRASPLIFGSSGPQWIQASSGDAIPGGRTGMIDATELVQRTSPAGSIAEVSMADVAHALPDDHQGGGDG